MVAACKPTSMAVVDGKFCAPRRTVFMLTKSHTQKGSEFQVTCSAHSATVMQVDTAHIGYSTLRFLDAASRLPVVTLEELGNGKLRSWECFRGDGTSGSDRLFLALDKASFYQAGPMVHVFIDGDSSSDQAPDFVVHGNYSTGAMTVSRGGGDGGHDKDIAKIDRKNTPGDAKRPPGENKYTVWIKPDVDQAFVLALTVVVDQI
ncbi:hypothetical protein ACQ4PT_038476 [Festuca glaucescens]